MTTTAAAHRRLPGGAIAGATAAVSGVSVLVNASAVHGFVDPVAYTTAKNVVAGALIGLVALVAGRRRAGAPARGVRGTATRAAGPRARPGAVSRRAGIAYVGVMGGGVAFALFFTGLSDTTALPAAFLHDTLVVFVALACLPVLGERVRPANLAAIGALVAGAVTLSGGVGSLAPTRGNLLVLGATLLWAGEVLVAKRLLVTVAPERLAAARLGIGAVVLCGYLAGTGRLAPLAALSSRQVGWLLVTGALLALYVGTWFVALSRARAIDVTSILVASGALTALLDTALGRAALGGRALLGVGLVLFGTALVYARWPRAARA